MLSTESYEKMAESLYDVNWQDLPVDLQKYFFIMIMNMQRPLFYHGFGFYVLKLETFVAVSEEFLQKTYILERKKRKIHRVWMCGKSKMLLGSIKIILIMNFFSGYLFISDLKNGCYLFYDVQNIDLPMKIKSISKCNGKFESECNKNEWENYKVEWKVQRNKMNKIEEKETKLCY